LDLETVPLSLLEDPVAPARRSTVRTGITLGIGAVVVLVLLPLVGGIGSLLGAIGNPFATDRHERSETAVLTALGDLSEYRAARAELQVVVEVEEDVRYIPGVVAGRSTTFLAGGDVDAFVDLGGIGVGAVETQDDGSVVVTLPPPRLAEPRIDPDRSRVLDRDRGVVNRVGDAFRDSQDDGELYSLAQEELRAAAGETELLERAESNAAQMVQDLLGEAGFDDIDVRFESPDTADV
jgi:hypothetical protein